MAFSSCFTCFKNTVFVFNFLLWLLGCALLAVGGWLLTEEDAGRYVEKVTSTSADPETPLVISYSQVTDTNLATPVAYLFLVFGTGLVLVAIIGCCGTVRENMCLLTAFGILLVVLFVVLLGIGVWSSLASKKVDVHTHQLHRLTSDTLHKTVREYYTHAESRVFMDTVQKKFECCGVDNGTEDYTSRGPVSQSPCEADYQHKSCLPVYFNFVANHFEAFVRDRLLLVAHLSIAFALCLVVHMVFVVFLCCAVRGRSRNVSV
ncbi:hypothetical protein ACOMHN_059042 [Nucella lapillus]